MLHYVLFTLSCIIQNRLIGTITLSNISCMEENTFTFQTNKPSNDCSSLEERDSSCFPKRNLLYCHLVSLMQTSTHLVLVLVVPTDIEPSQHPVRFPTGYRVSSNSTLCKMFMIISIAVVNLIPNTRHQDSHHLICIPSCTSSSSCHQTTSSPAGWGSST